MARRPDELRARVPPGVEVTRGDVLDPASLAPALAGVDTAYYLVHAMAAPRGFAREERDGARHFARRRARPACGASCTSAASVATSGLSPHLASRHEVGRILRASGVPTLELRASIVIGSGSLSFEMVRALVERLPVMLTPRWVSERTQPIAIDGRDRRISSRRPTCRCRRARSSRSAAPTACRTSTSCASTRAQRGLRRVFVARAGAHAVALEALARPRDAGVRARRPQARSTACATRPS